MFDPSHLLPILQRLPAAKRYWIALSGGLDSTVLLHAMVGCAQSLPNPLCAIHVDHGLSDKSEEWSEWCRQQCESLNVEYYQRRVEVDSRRGGVEAAAREARYAAFEALLGEGDVMLTAHHQDDQAETLLLQLLRGGGVRGLAAMPESRPLGKGALARPLLGFSREELHAYAERQGLEWIDDPSNFDTSLERNHLRHELIPVLENRNRQVKTVLARSAGHFAETAILLDELAAIDFAGASAEDCLSVSQALQLSPPRQRNLLRYWLRQRGLPVPDSRNLQRVLDEVLIAAVDATPLVSWHGGEVRRYRDRLYAMSPLPLVPAELPAQPWQGENEIRLANAMGGLHMVRREGDGLDERLLQQAEVRIAWREGGEWIELPGRGRHSLKKLYQEAGVPTWERERRPLILINGKLAQVAGLWTDKAFICGKDESGMLFEWSYTIENSSENKDN